ncbi:uncharacterized protein LOC113560658 [Rhopalosiphum maidis]|uniref:uncharacterized protein LOC113549002 n=1 Tax=Rhopalosiphum maidis TaxID=43146 RepID=UPI000EFEFC39|nr:uncharacterized protein LOC113549002 [Rhopalosiphum maidis]XP_026822469.1 uncharacterized protein LOC113560658 [Rhopalosiphum maidis]XP_026822470.1 uncharacterized protein LOC113560658 [Rhopalosiphum maidis]
MTSAKCFLGCTNVRYGARIISILDFWIGVLLLIKCLVLLNPFYDDFYYYNSRTEQILYDFTIFSYLFLISVFLNVNYYLKESTYDHKIHKIYQWLAINTIFLSFHILAVTYITIKNYYPIILYYSIPICIIHLCQIYVVKSFYDDELFVISRSLPTASSAVARQSNVAVVNQNSSNGSVNVTLSAPSAPNPIYQAQSAPPPPLQEQQEAGWARCNGATLPIPVATPIYPQLHHGQSGHNGIEQHFQNSMQMQAGPSSVEVQYPQEYYNLPAYLPPYDQRSVRKM